MHTVAFPPSSDSAPPDAPETDRASTRDKTGMGPRAARVARRGYSRDAISPLDRGPAHGATLTAQLRDLAMRADRGESTLAASIRLLRDARRLDAAHCMRWVDDWRALYGTLLWIAGVDLSLARVLEGHANALQLVERLGTQTQREQIRLRVREGSLLGVWGADGEDPVRLSSDGCRLQGTKAFASGLGLVDVAILTAARDGDQQLCVVDVAKADAEDGSRARPGRWQMSGMRASASGDYCVDGLGADAFALLGAPGVYQAEPWFLGGVWRIAAIQLGGTFGLLESARATLASRGRLDADAQVARLAPLVHRAIAAAGLVERAADHAHAREAVRDPERAVALSVFARLHTEALAQDAIGACERSVGLAHFRDDAPTGRQARDLSVYLRQAAGDALLLRAGRHALLGDAPLASLAVSFGSDRS
ncbi:MAG: hypothetical protein AB7P21_24200 [Lautropia sp.]